MKHLRIFVLVMAYGLWPMAHELFAEQITLDLSTATDLNGNPVVYSPSPIANTYYDLTHVWEHTYNDADSCQAILVNGGVFSFSHLPSQMSYGGMSWEGFTLSCVSQDTANVLGCVAMGGLAGVASPYMIGYYSEWVSATQGYSSNTIAFDQEYYPEYVYICQNSNTYKAITQGEYNARAFSSQDTLALTIQALDSLMQPTASITYYLAVDGKMNSDWVKVPLAALGKTACLGFSMSTTDMGEWGANTPLYFALDGLTLNTEPLTALPSVSSRPTSCTKILRNGQLIILQNGVEHSITGQKLRQ